MQLRTYIAIQVLKLYTHAHACSRFWFKPHYTFMQSELSTAELFVKCKCRFICVKQEQTSKKLENTSWRHQCWACDPDDFWSGRTTFSYQNWSGQTIFSQPKMVRTIFSSKIGLAGPFYLDHFFCDRATLMNGMQ